jgi:hypothetical protein
MAESDEVTTLTPEQKAELYELEVMFHSLGWATFQREFSATLASLTTAGIDNCKTVEELWHLKGVLATLRQITEYESDIEARKAQWAFEEALTNE